MGNSERIGCHSKVKQPRQIAWELARYRLWLEGGWDQADFCLEQELEIQQPIRCMYFFLFRHWPVLIVCAVPRNPPHLCMNEDSCLGTKHEWFNEFQRIGNFVFMSARLGWENSTIDLRVHRNRVHQIQTSPFFRDCVKLITSPLATLTSSRSGTCVVSASLMYY